MGGDRARGQGLPLELVHVVPNLLLEGDAPPVAEQRSEADRVLRAGRQLAAHAPAVEAEIRRVEPLGLEVAPAIVATAEPADMLVLGARGHGRVSGLLLGSVSQYAARHARGTVVVLRDVAEATATRTVVGFDQTAGAQRALEWAMARAVRRGEDVIALRAWHGTALHGAANPLPLPQDAAWRQEKEDASLDSELAPWRDKHPGVALRGEAVPGHAARLLTAASQHTELVVVGTRKRGPLAETLLSSVAQAVLHHAHCPVAVVR